MKKIKKDWRMKKVAKTEQTVTLKGKEWRYVLSCLMNPFIYKKIANQLNAQAKQILEGEKQ